MYIYIYTYIFISIYTYIYCYIYIYIHCYTFKCNALIYINDFTVDSRLTDFCLSITPTNMYFNGSTPGIDLPQFLTESFMDSFNIKVLINRTPVYPYSMLYCGLTLSYIGNKYYVDYNPA